MTTVNATSSIRRRAGFLRTRRGLAASATLLVICAASAAAYAQFTSSGSDPSASAGAATDRVTIGPTTVGPLSPQLNPADTTPVTVTVDNTGASGTFVGRITGAVRTSGGCQSVWFTVAPVAPPGIVAPGEHSYPSSVVLIDDDRNQTACTSQKQTIDWTHASSSSASSG